MFNNCRRNNWCRNKKYVTSFIMRGKTLANIQLTAMATGGHTARTFALYGTPALNEGSVLGNVEITL